MTAAQRALTAESIDPLTVIKRPTFRLGRGLEGVEGWRVPRRALRATDKNVVRKIG